MNKQAFTFLTLFTLVLMLAIYYVTLPSGNGTIQPDELIVNTESNPIDEYKENKKTQNEESRLQNEQVISDRNSTSEQKLEALSNNTRLEQTALQEEQIEASLKEVGYSSCFVEKTEEMIRVVLPKEHQSTETALNVMKTIQSLSEKDVFVEVSFE